MDDAEAIMTEQQYTCPKCLKDYTRFTIAEHYACGVEPLEQIKPDAITQKTNKEGRVDTVEAESEAIIEADEVAPTQQISPAPQPTEPKPAPKKRGPKPKNKTVA
jgi:hypothetical protein